MKRPDTRRRFFGKARNLFAFGAAASLPTTAASNRTSTEVGVDYYDKLGVTKIINAGTYTFLTASIRRRRHHCHWSLDASARRRPDCGRTPPQSFIQRVKTPKPA
jgi:hypothetical protein